MTYNGATQLEESDLDSDSDICSADEEIAMLNNAISLSQDMLQDMSVRDIPMHLDDDQDLVLALSEELSWVITASEKKAMKDLGIYIISLTSEPSPVMLGRDQFYAVFGETFCGADVFYLSRRHCVFHVTCDKTSASDPVQRSMSVAVENTSTNGLEVNGRTLNNGERRELHLGDTVTLMRSHNRRVSFHIY